jgi:hypothetical protein
MKECVIDYPGIQTNFLQQFSRPQLPPCSTGRSPWLRSPVFQSGYDFDDGRRFGRQGLPNCLTKLMRALHTKAQTPYFLRNPGKTDGFEAIQFLGLSGPIAINVANVGYPLR